MVKVAIQKFGATHWHFVNANVVENGEIREGRDEDILCTLEPSMQCEAQDNKVDEVREYSSYSGWDEFADALTQAYKHCIEKGWLPMRAGELVKIANLNYRG